MHKNMLCEIRITDLGVNGEGIGRLDGFTLFVEGGLPGELVEIMIIKLKKNYGYGKLIKVIEPSLHRIPPACNVFPGCGGCSLQHLAYPEQLKYKTKKVMDSLARIGGFDLKVSDTIGMESPLHYRNKAQFPFGFSNGVVVTGFYANRSHRVIPIKSCLIQHPINKEIIMLVTDFLNKYSIAPYDELHNKGLVRHLVTRIGFSTGEVMVCLVINGTKLPYHEKLVHSLMSISGIVSVQLNINKQKTNVILGSENIVIWGKPRLIDNIGPFQYEISPHSFFQVNPVQTKILYELVVKYALSGGDNKIIIDAYCGIGTISLFLASRAKKVYGIEENPTAVADARRNAELNNVLNVEFIQGKSEFVIEEMHRQDNIKADIVVIDPPRKGCDKQLLKMLLSISPSKIVYVSCDPATLARDMRILCEDGDYIVEGVQPVDCFCWTGHVETVVLMSK